MHGYCQITDPTAPLPGTSCGKFPEVTTLNSLLVPFEVTCQLFTVNIPYLHVYCRILCLMDLSFYTRAALSVPEITSCLLEHLQMVDVNKNPTQGLKVVCLSHIIPSFETLTYLCKIMISSCISSLTTVAERIAIAMLTG